MKYIAEDSTIEIYFNTVDSTGAPVAPSSAFAASDFAVHKNGSATEKTSTNGITVTSPFDSEVGLHLISIDTSNDTSDAGFWTADGRYAVRFNTAKTIDSISIDGRMVPNGEFSIKTFGDATAANQSTIAAAIATAQTDLDSITDNGVELATVQSNYAPAKAGDSMNLADNAITSAKFDESTAFPVASADAGSTALARTGADGDTLETLSDQIDNTSTSSAVSTIDTNLDALIVTVGNLNNFDPTSDTVILSSTQSAITFGAITISVSGSTSNVTFAGSGSGDVFDYTRSGSGGLFATPYSTALDNEIRTAIGLATANIDTQFLTINSAIDNLNDFDPANDTVAHVELVDTTTTNTDMRGTDNAALATSLPTNFADLAITASTGRVTVGTNTDKTGYSIAGTLTTLDAFNTAITTYGDSNWATAVGFSTFDPDSDVVANVALVDVCTINSDMRGTDGANTTAPDNASIAQILIDTDTTIPALINNLDDITSDEVKAAVAAIIVEAEGNYTLQQALSVIMSVLSGQSSDNGLTFKTPNGNATRAVAVVDENKNRTSMTLTPSE